MVLSDKIRVLREMNKLSQEEMAAKMNMSRSGYAKLERGESKLNVERLEQIADIFQVGLMELVAMANGATFNFNENATQSNYYGNSEKLTSEIEKLNLVIQHQQELLAQKDKEIELLRRLIEK